MRLERASAEVLLERNSARLERASAEVPLERSSARLERAASAGVRLERAAPTDVLLERASCGTWPVSFFMQFVYKCIPVSRGLNNYHRHLTGVADKKNARLF